MRLPILITVALLFAFSVSSAFAQSSSSSSSSESSSSASSESSSSSSVPTDCPNCGIVTPRPVSVRCIAPSVALVKTAVRNQIRAALINRGLRSVGVFFRNVRSSASSASSVSPSTVVQVTSSDEDPLAFQISGVNAECQFTYPLTVNVRARLRDGSLRTSVVEANVTVPGVLR